MKLYYSSISEVTNYMNRKRKKTLLVIALFVGLLLCILMIINMKRKEGNGKEQLKEYALIALHQDKIVYDYFGDNHELIIGYYEEETDSLKDVAKVANFYMSKGVVTIIKDDIYYPMTLYTGEHKIIKVNIVEDTKNILYTEEDAYGLDVLSTMNDELYQLSGNRLEDGSVIRRIGKYNFVTGEMEILIQKDSKGEESIEGFCCNKGNVYAVVKANSDIFVEIYDEKGTLQERVELCEKIKTGLEYGVVHFYVFGEYAYIRNYADEGMIAKFKDGKLEVIYSQNNLRFADDSRSDAITNPIFFLREGKTILVLNEEKGSIEEIKLDLLEGESIRSMITDGKRVCISVLDETNSKAFQKKDIRIVDIDDLR